MWIVLFSHKQCRHWGVVTSTFLQMIPVWTCLSGDYMRGLEMCGVVQQESHLLFVIGVNFMNEWRTCFFCFACQWKERGTRNRKYSLICVDRKEHYERNILNTTKTEPEREKQMWQDNSGCYPCSLLCRSWNNCFKQGWANISGTSAIYQPPTTLPQRGGKPRVVHPNNTLYYCIMWCAGCNANIICITISVT